MKHFFIQILADRLNERKTLVPEKVNWDEIMYLANIHRLEGMVYGQCRTSVPPALFASAMYQFKAYSEIEKAISAVEKYFTEKNIEFLIVKGWEVAQLYPVPKERTMGDIDLVVRPKDKVRAKDALLELGFSSVSFGMYEWEFKLNSVSLELHDHLQYENISASKTSFEYTETVFDHAKRTGASAKLELDWNFHLVFLLMHLRKHFINGGVGLRLFVDLAVVCQKAQIDYSLLLSELERLEILEFAKVCFAFCEKWFEVKMPFSYEISEEFFVSSSESILGNGLFGKEESDNYVLARITENGRFSSVFGRYFPSVKKLKDDPSYSYLEKFPFLLPFAWLCRFSRQLKKSKLKDEFKLFSQFFSSKKKVDERNRFLSQWKI